MLQAPLLDIVCMVFNMHKRFALVFHLAYYLPGNVCRCGQPLKRDRKDDDRTRKQFVEYVEWRQHSVYLYRFVIETVVTFRRTN